MDTFVLGQSVDSGIYQIGDKGKAIIICRDEIVSHDAQGNHVPGVKYVLRAVLSDGNKYLYDKKIHFQVTKPMQINTGVFFYIEDALGFKSAICAGFGESVLEEG